MIELTLPYPPSLNHFKTVGHLKITEKGKMYQPRFYTSQAKRFFYEVWMKCQQEGVKSLQGSTISLTLWVYPPDQRKRDLDNILKILCDSLAKAGCFNDDSQIARLLVKRMYTINGGQIICRIESYEPRTAKEERLSDE